jgi:glutaminyl-tRNA synthetase
VKNKAVSGWDDPRMPTLSGFRRKGYTPDAIRKFCEVIGVAKRESIVDLQLLEYCLREDLNKRALRVMAVLDPLKVVITNYPEDKVEMFEAENNPEDPNAGKREIPFSKYIYIEKEDFMENPPKKYFRLSPGQEIRLKHAYYVKCESFVKNDKGEVTEVHCTYDPETRGGWLEGGRKVKGTSHWVSQKHAISAEVRLYDNLFKSSEPEGTEEGKTCFDNLNPDSLKILKDCRLESSLLKAEPGISYQFLRQGYFTRDSEGFKEGKVVFNRTVTLKDTWVKTRNSGIIADRE